MGCPDPSIWEPEAQSGTQGDSRESTQAMQSLRARIYCRWSLYQPPLRLIPPGRALARGIKIAGGTAGVDDWVACLIITIAGKGRRRRPRKLDKRMLVRGELENPVPVWSWV